MKENEPQEKNTLMEEITVVLFHLESLVAQGLLPRELVDQVLDRAEQGDYEDTNQH